ncbi:hypothetical protein HF888_01220 [Bermanella marisrubri]|uniref:Lipoprotein n=1 Tax=Bermanella marisrubri TaxID=207949 RepID=Q1N4D1_9GAMM|nr:DUF6279 family lipoprotein [Bermanella marisrubri]EAT12934.1 hypothetical protein RED65_14597 [Oceanobacter sp. RED65] [Bermanella marisrubri]QIZ82935.1 hypothetical protein HF888_01220 [Bermanella marisrubri]
MRKFLLAFLIIGLVTGCSSRFAYNNLDWIIPWYLDDYIEFEGEQESAVKARLIETLNWHRQQQLPIYIKDIDQLQQQIEQGPLSQQQWLDVINHVYGYWLTIRNQFVDDLVVLSPQLTQDQVNQLFAELEERNQDREEDWQDLNASEHKEKRYERLSEQVEDFVGDLTNQQLDRIQMAVDQMQETTEVRLQYLRDYQTQLRQVFKQAASDEARIKQLANILKQTDKYKPQQYRDILQHNRSVVAQLFADLQASLTANQKRQLIEKLADLRLDLKELQNN